MSDDYFNPTLPEPDNRRYVDSAQETPAEGGGYNFVFYDRRRGSKPKKKKAPPDFGVPVEIQLSDEAKARLNTEGTTEDSTSAGKVVPASAPPAAPATPAVPIQDPTPGAIPKNVQPSPAKNQEPETPKPGGHLDITV